MNWLLADIGGTSSRCALWKPGGGRGPTEHYFNSDFTGPISLLSNFMDSLPGSDRPRQAWIAVAAPISSDDHVSMINIDWAFSRRQLMQQLGLETCEIINDFGAQAYCVPGLGDSDWVQIGHGDARGSEVCAVIGPGTGLGVALLVPTSSGWQAVTGEGGHVSLAGQDAREEEMVRVCREKFGHCSAERLISGPGLSIIHQLLHGEASVDPAEIGRRARNGDRLAGETLEQMFVLLGAVASDLALTAGASGGVYISGGIVPRYIDLLAQSGFRERFENKGRYRDYMQRIVTRVITLPDPALSGLATLAQTIG